MRKGKNPNILDYGDTECTALWSSSNLVEIRGDPSKSVSYKVQTAVLYELKVKGKQEEVSDLHGLVKKNVNSS